MSKGLRTTKQGGSWNIFSQPFLRSQLSVKYNSKNFSCCTYLANRLLISLKIEFFSSEEEQQA